jgi:PTH1 family peptidyl-tRNA hydrolase
MQSHIQLIVGLGNPGAEYEDTRHNAGAWFLAQLLEQYPCPLHPEKKFHGLTVKTTLFGHTCHLLAPTTYMNHSGHSVRALAMFYKILPQNILVAHDELDLPCGTVQLKQDGGHAGHNGLRDIIAQLGSKDFLRLRIGISHPGDKEQAITVLPHILSGDIATAMQQLHT